MLIILVNKSSANFCSCYFHPDVIVGFMDIYALRATSLWHEWRFLIKQEVSRLQRHSSSFYHLHVLMFSPFHRLPIYAQTHIHTYMSTYKLKTSLGLSIWFGFLQQTKRCQLVYANKKPAVICQRMITALTVGQVGAVYYNGTFFNNVHI